MIGQTLAHYRITAALGAGGMGEVYRATDTKLGRDVAIKVLPSELAREPDRLARFEREAKLLASLNHPNIAHVYGFESATPPDGPATHFLAMELVEGEDLAERLRHGAIPVDEAIAIARQVAEALDEAHEHGIVHRDLKPANVKVTPDGKVKVLDFGLAKAYAGDSAPGSGPDLSQSPTLTYSGTQAGVILGTAAYMSPEQARGKAVDKRTDIWAFGVLLFEMLSGRQLFAGETVSDVLAAVLTREPEWSTLPPATSPAIRRLLRRCLERNSRQRLRDIGEARLAIEGLLAGDDGDVRTVAIDAGSPARRAILVTAGLFAALFLGWWLARRTAPEAIATLVRFPLVSDPAITLTTELTIPFAVTPDGRTVVFTARRGDEPKSLWRRTLDDPEPHPIADTQGGTQPAISPDGQWIAFLIGFHEVRKVRLDGGPAVRLGDIEGRSAALTWASDDELLVETFAPGSGLQRLNAAGGNPREVFPLDTASGEVQQRAPFVLPGEDRVVYQSESKDGRPTLVLASLGEGRRSPLGVEGARALGLFGGRLLYARPDGHLAAVPIDSKAMRATGPSIELPDHVASSGMGARVALSAGGTLVYRSGSTPSHLVLFDGTGPPRPLGKEVGAYSTPRFSPDGRRIAVALASGAFDSSLGRSSDLWVLDRDSGQATRLTRTGTATTPAWTPDGRHLAFNQGVPRLGQVWRLALDGSAPPSRWLELDGDFTEATVGPDGHSLVAISWAEGRQQLVRVDLGDGQSTLDPLLAHEEALRWPECPRISPDGRFVAFKAEPDEVYVRPLGGAGILQVTESGGSCPAWGPDSRMLYYGTGRDLSVATLQTSPTLAVAGRRVVAQMANPVGDFDLAPDGKTFVLVAPVTGGSDVFVAVDWLDTLRTLP